MKFSHVLFAAAIVLSCPVTFGRMLRETTKHFQNATEDFAVNSDFLRSSHENGNENSTSGPVQRMTIFSKLKGSKLQGPSTWIGMISAHDPTTGGCKKEDQVYIYMDDEDRSNRNYFEFNGESYKGVTMSIGGLGHPVSPRRAGGNTWIYYCRTQVGTLPHLSHDYAVISASDKCPKNSYRFWRRWDNEDSGNNNHYDGNISPNISNKNTKIYFCFVPGKTGRPKWDPLFDGSMIFSQAPLSNSGVLYEDDQDKRNNNKYGSEYTQYLVRMQQLISSGKNTYMYFGTQSEVTLLNFGTKKGCKGVDWNLGVRCDFNTQGLKECKPMLKELLDTATSIVEYGWCLW